MCKGAAEFGVGPQLVWCVGKETNLTLAEHASIACTRAVLGGVQPVLEYAVSELAGVAPLAFPVAEGRAGDGGVEELARVPALSLLTTVGVGALRPIVATHPGAAFDLVSVHAEFIGPIDGFIKGIVVSSQSLSLSLGLSMGLGKVKARDKLLLWEFTETGIGDIFQHFSRLMGNNEIIQNQMQVQNIDLIERR